MFRYLCCEMALVAVLVGIPLPQAGAQTKTIQHNVVSSFNVNYPILTTTTTRTGNPLPKFNVPFARLTGVRYSAFAIDRASASVTGGNGRIINISANSATTFRAPHDPTQNLASLFTVSSGNTYVFSSGNLSSVNSSTFSGSLHSGHFASYTGPGSINNIQYTSSGPTPRINPSSGLSVSNLTHTGAASYVFYYDYQDIGATQSDVIFPTREVGDVDHFDLVPSDRWFGADRSNGLQYDMTSSNQSFTSLTVASDFASTYDVLVNGINVARLIGGNSFTLPSNTRSFQLLSNGITSNLDYVPLKITTSSATSTFSVSAFSTVPEPTSFASMGTLAVCWQLIRRKQRK